MNEFFFDEKNIKKAAVSAILVNIPLIVIGIIIFFGIVRAGYIAFKVFVLRLNFDLNVYENIACLFVPLVLFAIMLVNTTRKNFESMKTYRLMIDPEKIMKTQKNCPDMIIRRHDIEKITFRKNGSIFIKNKDFRFSLNINKNINDISGIRELLKEHYC